MYYTVIHWAEGLHTEASPEEDLGDHCESCVCGICRGRFCDELTSWIGQASLQWLVLNGILLVILTLVLLSPVSRRLAGPWIVRTRACTSILKARLRYRQAYREFDRVAINARDQCDMTTINTIRYSL